MTEIVTFHSYLAGIVDGEGTITINRQRQHGRKTFQYRPRVYVWNNSKDLIDFCLKNYGGSFTKQKNGPCYRWGLFGHENIKRVLTAVYPFLVIKKKQSEIVLDFAKSRIENLNKEDHAAYTEFEKICYENVRVLNLRNAKGRKKK